MPANRNNEQSEPGTTTVIITEKQAILLAAKGILGLSNNRQVGRVRDNITLGNLFLL
jgi:hypothetical protein